MTLTPEMRAEIALRSLDSPTDLPTAIEAVARAIAAAVADEREACARECEEVNKMGVKLSAKACARRIRARGAT